MKALVLRALARATEEAGEATLEFFLALATKRLQLAQTHLDEVKAAALDGDSRPRELHRALQFLLTSATASRRARQRFPF